MFWIILLIALLLIGAVFLVANREMFESFPDEIDVFTNRPLDSWMGTLDQNIPYNQIKIPGTHNSLTYGYTEMLVVSYVRTQDSNITRSLNDGIRYMDLRIRKDGDGCLVGFHGGYNMPVEFKEVAVSIRDFLNVHRSEVLIINLTLDSLAIVDGIRIVNDYLKPLIILPSTGLTPASTLAQLVAAGNIIIASCISSDMFFARDFIWDPYDHDYMSVTNSDQFIPYINRIYCSQTPKNSSGVTVMQAVSKYTVWDMINPFKFFTLRKGARVLNRSVIDGIGSQSITSPKGGNGFNVIMVDFYAYCGCHKFVIGLN